MILRKALDLIVQKHYFIAHFLEALVATLELLDVRLRAMIQNEVYHNVIFRHVVLHYLHLVQHFLLERFKIYLDLLVPQIIQAFVCMQLCHPVSLLPIDEFHDLIDRRKEIK